MLEKVDLNCVRHKIRTENEELQWEMHEMMLDLPRIIAMTIQHEMHGRAPDGGGRPGIAAYKCEETATSNLASSGISGRNSTEGDGIPWDRKYLGTNFGIDKTHRVREDQKADDCKLTVIEKESLRPESDACRKNGDQTVGINPLRNEVLMDLPVLVSETRLVSRMTACIV
ncbi:UNVERIFIED_CONTAM: hypothetical protein K2H54_000849 [Gekko kuhli]